MPLHDRNHSKWLEIEYYRERGKAILAALTDGGDEKDESDDSDDDD